MHFGVSFSILCSNASNIVTTCNIVTTYQYTDKIFYYSRIASIYKLIVFALFWFVYWHWYSAVCIQYAFVLRRLLYIPVYTISYPQYIGLLIRITYLIPKYTMYNFSVILLFIISSLSILAYHVYLYTTNHFSPHTILNNHTKLYTAVNLTI